MYAGDISIDGNGYTVIKNGSFTITPNDVEFILRSLKYGQNSWSLHPNLGFGLEKYIGMVNNEVTHDLILKEMTDYFMNLNIIIDPIIFPVGDNDIAIHIDLPLVNIGVGLVFSLDSGIFIIDDSNREEQAKLINDGVRRQNKYLDRRFIIARDPDNPAGTIKVDIT